MMGNLANTQHDLASGEVSGKTVADVTEVLACERDRGTAKDMNPNRASRSCAPSACEVRNESRGLSFRTSCMHDGHLIAIGVRMKHDPNSGRNHSRR